MDTKSKEFKKYPLIVKALCLVLAALCVAGAAACGIYALFAAEFGVLKLTDEKPSSFYETDFYSSMLMSDVQTISELMLLPQKIKAADEYEQQKDAVVERETQRFLSQKASIIRGEIYYVATHYDEIEDDYYYDAYMRDFSTTTTTDAQLTEPTAVVQEDMSSADDTTAATVPPEEPTSADVSDDLADLSPLPKLNVDAHAPYNVRYCQSLCNTVSGLDWLQYASLVREDAFSRTFRAQFDDLGSDDSVSFSTSDTQIRSLLSDTFDCLLEQYRSDLSYAGSELAADESAQLKYLAVAQDGTKYTNMTAEEQNSKNILSHNRCVLCKDGSVTVQPQGERQSAKIAEIVRSQIAAIDGTLYMYLEDQPVPGDRYTQAEKLYNTLFGHFSAKILLITAAACCIGALLLSIILLCLCGHKAGADGITLAFIDRMPTDVHLLLSGGCVIAAGVLTILALDSLPFFDSISWGFLVYDWDKYLVRMAVAVCLLLFAYLCGVEWLTSTVRIKKAGQSFFRRFVLWKLVRLVFRGLQFCLRKVVAGIRFLLDKPKKLRYLPFLVCALYAAAVLLVALVSAAAGTAAPVCIGIPILTVLLILGTVRFLRMLDRIAEAAETRTDLPESVTCKMPRALRALAESQSVTNRELDKAVADAVRNERTKAELITNVSHDLKTPLTSVITYVDLLKKCDITDEKALEYLDVLDEKSAKLKRLVEDLIEASKVNTGNVTLQCVPLNLAELATQAVTEAAPDFEENDLDLKFSPSDASPIVFADGSKTYRILDNLLSNAKKYSAAGSRVYVKVDEDETCGIFEIKNISREPLDVDPQELMERFVRGDRSRSQDGNGLGLSIAQQLCLLQGGRLELQIDGDLFKATVYLPKQKPAEERIR